MAAEGGGVDQTPALDLTSDEKRVYGQLFRQADTDGVGVVTGETAVKFFEKTRLDQRVLGEIWQIADSENRGFLTPAGFSAVLRLIGHAQANREPSSELASQPGPLPQFDGIQLALLSPQQTAAPLQSQGTGGASRIPPLTPEKVSQYASLFDRQSLQTGGLLPGDQAKAIFDKAGLPNEVLGRIWQLADTESRGALVQTEFIIAMHLLTSMKSGALRVLPSILPAPLYEAATRQSPAPRQSPSNTGTLSAIPRQMSGSQPMRVGSPLGRAPIATQTTGGAAGDWLVMSADKVRFDQLYDDLDKAHKGFITGEEAVPFLSQSKLPEDTLAQIWDLADFTSEGRLNRDTFAVAMYLIRQQRTKPGPLPASLPPNLIPPAMRGARPQPTVTSSPFDAPAMQQASAPAPVQATAAPKSALEDLFGLDSNPGAVPDAQAARTTGGSNADPFAAGSHGPSSPVRPSPSATQFKPFIPSSSFGRGLATHPTGDSIGSGNSSANKAPAADDLLGDNDPEESKKLTTETTELANLSNQVSSLSKQMHEVQGQRNTTQQEFNQASAQKKNFEQRLAQLRAMYEKEAGDLQKLQEQLRVARSETQKLQGECMTLDVTYRELHTQHGQVAASLEADRQENASLKEKIRAVNAEVAQLKPQIERLKSEARQQKGLVSINKKQLSTNEGERQKLQMEAADLAKNNTGVISRQDTGSSVPGSVTSPAASVASGNNPFFKRTGSTDIMGAFASPAAKPSNDKLFDDIFGPSDHAPGTSSTPPTIFKPQSTGASTGSVSSYSTPPAVSPTISRQGTLAEPPAPPESRQISSSFLPFAAVSESLSSSRAVSPPISRDEEVTEAVTTPTQAPPGAFPEPSSSVGNSAPEEPKENGDANPGMESAAPTDSFASIDKAQAKADFENAFASFTKARKSPEPAGESRSERPAFDTEFPPISELEREEDDSDTASERGGFDDDFAPASPPSKQPVAATGPAVVEEASSTTNVDNTTTPAQGAMDISDPHASAPLSAAPAVAPASHTDDAFGSSPQPAQGQPSQKVRDDDFDDDFEGLEDAKEGSADDDFQTISRSAVDDFNPVFDSSPPQNHAKINANTAPFGQEASYDFGNVSQASVVTEGATPADVKQQKASSPEAATHDWDAIFSTLDSPTAQTGASTFPQAPEAEGDRPGPGRTVTSESKDDDPILRNLTGMGYSRTDALAALEKYDYNLERAANYLASQS